MSYTGLTYIMTEYCRQLEHPRILEIGVDRGQTALPLIANLLQHTQKFKYLGVDIRNEAVLHVQLDQLYGAKFPEPPRVSFSPEDAWNVCYLFETNSLDVLPRLCSDPTIKFDLVLLDGDHNYATVKQELEYLKQLTHPLSLIVCDDYHGRHAGKDSYYRDYDNHKDLQHLHKDLQSKEGKAGVNHAIDDFLAENPTWHKTDMHLGSPENGFPMLHVEPVILSQRLDIALTLESVQSPKEWNETEVTQWNTRLNHSPGNLSEISFQFLDADGTLKSL